MLHLTLYHWSVGNIAPAPAYNQAGFSEYYYQESSGAIAAIDVTGPFNDNSASSATVVIVPAGQAGLGTPIAICENIPSGTQKYSYNDASS